MFFGLHEAFWGGPLRWFSFLKRFCKAAFSWAEIGWGGGDGVSDGSAFCLWELRPSAWWGRGIGIFFLVIFRPKNLTNGWWKKHYPRQPVGKRKHFFQNLWSLAVFCLTHIELFEVPRSFVSKKSEPGSGRQRCRDALQYHWQSHCRQLPRDGSCLFVCLFGWLVGWLVGCCCPWWEESE